MQYCTYQWYTEVYGGSAVQEDTFTRVSARVQALIDRITFNRIKSLPENEIPDEVRWAVCSGVDFAYQAEANDGHTVVSETVSKHSVTYGDAVKSVEAGVIRCARTYLDGTGLTYRGAYHHERSIHYHHH